MSVSADVDERTLRETYLRGFERAVKATRPWTVMCSYNRINGGVRLWGTLAAYTGDSGTMEI